MGSAAGGAAPRLKRELRMLGAVLMGLGAMLGTGVFVSIGIAAGIAGPAVLIALVIAAGIALCNGLSSAQLAAAHPVSGGTYEYGSLRSDSYGMPWRDRACINGRGRQIDCRTGVKVHFQTEELSGRIGK